MNTQRKYRCRKCGIDMPAGPYIAPEMCSACQLAANAEIARKAKGEHDLLKQLRRRPYSNPSFWMLEAADEIERLRAENERLRAYTDAYDKLLAERVEIECLRGLAIRAWNSFRSGLSATGGCRDGLTDGDILELVRLSNIEAAKNLERDVLHDCRQGKQRCHECPDTECADNMADEDKTNNQKSIIAGAERQLRIPKMPNEREDEPIE